MGQELGVETLNKVGAILTQYGASWCAWPAEISIEVQGTKEALGSAAATATPIAVVVVVVALWMLICCHCCREDRRIELILAGSLLIDLLHIDGTLIEHRLLHIAWHQRIVLQQQFPIGGLYKWQEGGMVLSYMRMFARQRLYLEEANLLPGPRTCRSDSDRRIRHTNAAEMCVEYPAAGLTWCSVPSCLLPLASPLLAACASFQCWKMQKKEKM